MAWDQSRDPAMGFPTPTLLADSENFLGKPIKVSKVINWVDVIAYLPIKKSTNIVSRPLMLTIEEESRAVTHITSIFPHMETQYVLGRNVLVCSQICCL